MVFGCRVSGFGAMLMVLRDGVVRVERVCGSHELSFFAERCAVCPSLITNYFPPLTSHLSHCARIDAPCIGNAPIAVRVNAHVS